jgi:hypothetical protein
LLGMGYIRLLRISHDWSKMAVGKILCNRWCLVDDFKPSAVLSKWIPMSPQLCRHIHQQTNRKRSDQY